MYKVASRIRLPFLHVLNVVHATSTCNLHLQQSIHFQPIAAIFQEKNVEWRIFLKKLFLRNDLSWFQTRLVRIAIKALLQYEQGLIGMQTRLRCNTFIQCILFFKQIYSTRINVDGCSITTHNLTVLGFLPVCHIHYLFYISSCNVLWHVLMSLGMIRPSDSCFGLMPICG